MFASTPWGAVGEFAASRHGVVSRKQAAGLGVSGKVVARMKASGYLSEPLSGVLVVVGSVPTCNQRLLVASLASSAAGVGGFRSAGALQRFDAYPAGPIELIVRNWRRGLVGVAEQHRALLDPCDVVEIDGIACTGIARTLADLGSVDPVDRVRVAFESVWRRGVSLLWLRETAERLHRPGQSGTRVLLQLLDEAEQVKRPTESALEVRLERCLRGIPGLVRQHEVLDNSGNFVARVDFAVPRVKLAIEAHSRQFHFAPGAVSDDEVREHALTRQGWEVLYFGERHTRSPKGVRGDVMAVIDQRTLTFGAK